MLAQRTGSQRTFYAARGVTGSEELFGIKLEGHTGQSSQLFPVATDRNAQFLATIPIGLNVSHSWVFIAPATQNE
jgi:hypothetical protein